ncbi:hypothetical protein C8J56DRAFT_1044314 [Mycena floridula]|nr:hypothetical protein C8J56DRAFT_1044314 [Mycena floridula]
MADSHFEKTPLNKVKRHAERGRYERAEVIAIARAALILHVAFISDGLPQCMPMIGAFHETEDGELFIYLHGWSSARIIKENEGGGTPLCITATHIDGYKMSLTPFNHGAQYRCAVFHGTTFPFGAPYDEDPEAAKVEALRLITNAVCENRWENTRLPPNAEEMRQTGILRVRVESASAKMDNSQQPGETTSDSKNEEIRNTVWTGSNPYSGSRA